MAPVGPVVTFRPAFTRAAALAVVAVVLVSLASIAAAEGPEALRRAAAAPVLVATAAWILFWRPEVEVSDGGVVLRNPFRIVRVPWRCLRGVDTTRALRLVTTDSSYAAWAAPSSGRSGGRTGDRTGCTGTAETVVVTRGVTAEAAAREVTARWATWRGSPGPDADERPEVSWRVATIVVLLGAMIWLQLAVLLR